MFNQFQLSYLQWCWVEERLGFRIDFSKMNLETDFLESMKPQTDFAIAEMAKLEQGVIANPDENRMVGHYWLRDSKLAPNVQISQAIEQTMTDILEFSSKIHQGTIQTPSGQKFQNMLVIGVGGSALGPQMVSRAIADVDAPMNFFLLDNTDPDGFDNTFKALQPTLDETLVIVISKSGGTKETRNGMLEIESFFTQNHLNFSRHAVAITMEGSALENLAKSQNWLKIFPMWDWIGGRTSELSAVGLLPAALQGIPIQSFLDGASAMDQATRTPEAMQNPSMLLALSWYLAGHGTGQKDMVILPYKDRLEYFGRYLQQLVMESLGKEFAIDGSQVNQGLVVYGNKGSTDQHAYIQQLREGANNFFVTFIQILQNRHGTSIEVEDQTTSGDYLHGFLLGSRQALSENKRQSILITLEKLDAFSLGALIALYERAVGFYATLVNVNAYHQPGVEAGKKAAENILKLQKKILDFIKTQKSCTAEECAKALDQDCEDVFQVLEYLRVNSAYISKTPNTISLSGQYCWQTLCQDG